MRTDYQSLAITIAGMCVVFFAILLMSPYLQAHSGGGVACHDFIGDPDCNCSVLSPYFGLKSWAAREIADRESNCDPGAHEAALSSRGMFQIHPVHCSSLPRTFTCPTNGASVTISSCNDLFDRTTNIIAACQLSSGGTDWSIWGAASACAIPSPPANQWLNPETWTCPGGRTCL